MSDDRLKPQGQFLLIIDASAYIHRAFHSYPRSTRSTDGLQTGALAGFCNTLLKITRLGWWPIVRLPSHVVIVCDSRGKNWRHDFFPAYKQQRKPYEEDLLAQLPHIPLIAEAFGIKCVTIPGVEADDIIASYAAAADYLDVVIASSDKDFFSLISVEEDEPMLLMYNAMADKGPDDNADALIGPHQVYRKFGVMPSQMMDFQAIVGDTVDNIPGVKGLGPKKAAALLEEFGTIENIIDEMDWDEERFNPKDLEKLQACREEMLISRKLVELKTDVPLPIEVDDLVLREAPSYQLRGVLQDYEFMHLVDRVDRPARRV